MRGEKNVTCIDDEYFVKEIDYRKTLNNKNILSAFSVMLKSIYSIEAKNNIAKLLNFRVSK